LSGAILIPYLSIANSYGVEKRHNGIALGVCASGVLLALGNIFMNKKLISTIAAPVVKKKLSFHQLVLSIIGIIFFVS
ncbi:peptide transporter, partial [Francisella tularensis subsp. holarctica]|nr:peptide transporter [Francisella tularensis subsp. holarctica]